MMKKNWLALVSFVLCMFLLAGCSGGTAAQSGSSGGEASASETAVKSGDAAARDDIILALGEEPVGLSGVDPWVLEYRDNFGIYEGLVTFGKGSDRIPDLAESIDISEDNSTYTFHLKENVTFHNGEPFTADDVLYSLDYLKNSDLSYQVPVQLETCEKMDDYTVTMTLNSPYAGFLDAMTNLLIVNQKAVEEGGDTYTRNPVGTGPYKFVSWQSGQSIVVERYDDYHGEKANIKTVTYRILPDKTTAELALENGEVDMMIDVPISGLDKVKSLPDVTVESTASPKQLYLFQSTRVPQNVRQAVGYAVDKQGLLDLIEGGNGHVAKSHFEGLIGYSGADAFYPYDPEKAKELLAGETPSYTILISTADDAKVAQIIQNNLRAVGINAEIESLENAAKNDKVVAGDFDMYYRIAGFSIPDMYDFTYGYKSDSSNNRVGMKREDYDKLMDEAQMEPDLTKREALYDQVMDIIIKEGIVVPVYFADTNVAYNKDLKNVQVSGLNYYNIATLSW